MQARNILSTFVTTGLAIATVASVRPALGEQASVRQATASEQDTSRHQMLSRRVNAYLASSGTLAGSDIKVTATGDVIILDGVVADREAKERAKALALKVSGGRDVQNNLIMDWQAVNKRRGPVVPDQELSKRVAQKLMSDLFPRARMEQDGVLGWEVDGDGWEIEIQADAGDITFSGHTARPEVIEDVINSARSVPGVRSVRSELEARTFDRPYGSIPEWGYHPYPVRRP